jgi:hypothetical protein
MRTCFNGEREALSFEFDLRSQPRRRRPTQKKKKKKIIAGDGRRRRSHNVRLLLLFSLSLSFVQEREIIKMDIESIEQERARSPAQQLLLAPRLQRYKITYKKKN